MEPLGILLLALVAFLWFGLFGLALAVVLVRSRGQRSRPDESWEEKADRLHHAVHPDEESSD
jgi:hypothetical protein